MCAIAIVCCLFIVAVITFALLTITSKLLDVAIKTDRQWLVVVCGMLWFVVFAVEPISFTCAVVIALFAGE